LGDRLNRKILFIVFLDVDTFKEQDYFGNIFGFFEGIFAGIYKAPISAVHHSCFGR